RGRRARGAARVRYPALETRRRDRRDERGAQASRGAPLFRRERLRVPPQHRRERLLCSGRNRPAAGERAGRGALSEASRYAARCAYAPTRGARLAQARPSPAGAMRIAFVTTNLRGGGAEKSVLRVAADLHSRGHLVHVVLLENIADHAVPDGIVLHSLTAAGEAASKGWFGRRISAWRPRPLFPALGAFG